MCKSVKEIIPNIIMDTSTDFHSKFSEIKN